MSRPADPSHTVIPFAPDTNYPAGAGSWNGNPTKVAPVGAASVGLTPNQGNAAQYHNYLHNQWSVNHASVKSKLEEAINYVGQIPARNFLRFSTSIGDLKSGFYSVPQRRWWVVGNVENIRSSDNHGLSWTGSSWAAAAGADENVTNGDADATGNACFATETRYVFTYAIAGAGTVAKVDVHGAAATGSARVVYEAVSGLWCWVFCRSDGTLFVRTSSDRVTWTTRTAPATFGLSAFDLAVGASGRIVLVSASGGKVATSDDGGITWVQRTDIVPGSPNNLGLTYNPVTATWLCFLGNSATFVSKVMQSTDNGVTWTEASAFTSACLFRGVALGAMWVTCAKTTNGTLSQTEMVYSLDGGVTWDRSGVQVQGDGMRCFGGDGGVTVVTSTHVYSSERMGKDTAPSLIT